MGDLSKNFNRSEFACKGKNCCGHSAAIHPDLVDALQALRDRIGKPLSITILPVGQTNIFLQGYKKMNEELCFVEWEEELG